MARAKKNVTTIGQISFDDLMAMMQSGEIGDTATTTSTTTSTATVITDEDWAAMFDVGDDAEDVLAAPEETSTLVQEVKETELVDENACDEAVLDFEPELEPIDELNIALRNGTAKVFAPATEPSLPSDMVERVRANAEAIRVAEMLIAKDEYADEAQQSILAKYSGWEGILSKFKRKSMSGDPAVDKELDKNFSEEEQLAMATLPMYPYSLPEAASHAIAKTLSTIGFKSGNILLHGTGNGSLMRSLPKKMVKNSRITLDATDDLNGDILSLLYPKNEIFRSEQVIRESFYDVAIALAPVYPEGNGVIVGRRGQIELPNFACSMVRTLSAVRNGGFFILMMDSIFVDDMNFNHSPFGLSTAPLNFVGGLRFDKDSFNNGAGYDILVFNKVDKGQAHDGGLLEKAVVNGTYQQNSSYFVYNEKNVVGEYKVDKNKLNIEPFDEPKKLTAVDAAIKGWNCKGIYKDVEIDEETEDGDYLPAFTSVRNFSMVVIKGDVYQRVDSKMVKQKLTGRALNRVKGMIAIRNQARKVVNIQVDDCTDEELRIEQRKLNFLYDSFVKEFDELTKPVNLRLFREDAEVTLLTSLEYTDEEDVIHKADIFTERTIKMRTVITSCDTVQEAYTLSLDQRGCADVSFMASLCNKTEEEVIEEIGGTLIFRDPTAGAASEQWIAADEYLSGNVVRKLDDAKKALEISKEFEANVKALEAVQPTLISSSEIKVSLSSKFLDEEYISQFIHEVIGDGKIGGNPRSFRFSKTVKGAIKIHANCYIPYNDPRFHNQFGTKDYSALTLIEKLMNNTQIVAMKDDTDASGKHIRVKDPEATLVLEEKAALIEDEFARWIFSDPAREAEIVHDYNVEYNNSVTPKYDGSHLTFPGMTANIELKQHQRNAVYRIIRDNGALIGHVVGAGKTITLLAAGMELKRLGRICKPVYLVPNNLLAQWGGEMMRLYPTANILLAEPDDMRKHRRKRFLARMATGNFDAIILGSSSFALIPAPADVVRDYTRDLSQKMYKARFEKKNGDGTVSRRNNYTSASDMITPRMEEDVLKTFMSNQTAEYTLEELGVDYLFVDEAHEFKNLYSGSSRGQIRGVSNSGSGKCSDLFYKTKYLSGLYGGKGGFTFATGTPIVNTIVELYNWQRFYQEDLLLDKGILCLDDWLSLFANVTSEWELPPEGLDEDGAGFRQVARVSSFKNVPELMKMISQFLDVVTRDEIDMETPDVYQKTVNCQPSLQQKEYMKQLVERANNIRKGHVRMSIDNMLKITNDGRHAALDIRTVNPRAMGGKTSKVNECAANILDFYKRYNGIRGTQIVFSDISTPNQPGFHVYGALKQALVTLGIPEDEIAFAHDFKTDRQRSTMRLKMQTGRLRVLIGSTQTIGQGVNVQNRLIALHNLDVPWVPKDIDQREGRIVRPGNMNPAVYIFNYVTEGSFDAYMWQTIEVKAKLISQILRGDYTQRVVEDTDTKVLTYSEIKAIATGDTRFLKRAKLEGEITRLESLKRSFEDQKKRLKQDVHKNLPNVISNYKALIPRIKEDIASLEAYTETIFERNSVRYDLADPEQRKLAAKAIPGVFSLKSGDVIGTFNGMSVVAQETNSYSLYNRELTIALQGNAAHRIDGRTVGSGRAILDLCYSIVRAIPESLEDKKVKLRTNETALKAATEMLNEPFEQEQQLAELKEEYAEITASLAA